MLGAPKNEMARKNMGKQHQTVLIGSVYGIFAEIHTNGRLI